MKNEREELGIGIIGGGFGVSRCPLIQKTDGLRLVAISSRSEERARKGAEQFGVDWYTDYRKILERKDIDIVGIYTPSGAHRDIAIEAAMAGKHLIITKPTEITLDRMDDIIAACSKARVKLATEFLVRYEPVNFNVFRAIQDGEFGKLRLAEFSEKLHRGDLYFASDGGWRATRSQAGGGVLMNQGIHQLDQIIWMLGRVTAVTARAAAARSDAETEDTMVATLSFESGAIGVLVATTTFLSDRPPSRYGGGTIRRLELNGAEASVTVVDNKLVMWKSTKREELPQSPRPAENVFDDFVQWVRDDSYSSPTLVKSDDARYLLSVIDALYRAADSGEVVRVGTQ
ncbi:MAG TPA: Gfo/Idh/MocA family oxidoreductase [Spirochaetia bacterium]|nr:Gfo/Idh/MocA family oxidoreductase [Spirochaetia bacterium]